MAATEEDIYCRNCSELLFRVLRNDDGTTVMKDPGIEPRAYAGR